MTPILCQPGLNFGLVGWWPFDGNASDMSGNENHGTVNGATLGADRFGQVGMAYDFDGVDDFIVVSDSNKFDFENRGFSISSWVKKFSQVNSNVGMVLGQIGILVLHLARINGYLQLLYLRGNWKTKLFL